MKKSTYVLWLTLLAALALLGLSLVVYGGVIHGAGMAMPESVPKITCLLGVGGAPYA